MNSKTSCVDDIRANLKRTGRWRKQMARRYPGDMRNEHAAEMLEKLADEAASMTDSEWRALQPNYSWASERWNRAISEAARRVGFRTIPTFSVFLEDLFELLAFEAAA